MPDREHAQKDCCGAGREVWLHQVPKQRVRLLQAWLGLSNNLRSGEVFSYGGTWV